MTYQDQDQDSQDFYQHHYSGQSHMYSGRLPDRINVNMRLVEILSYYNNRDGESFHFCLFLRDGTQLSVLREFPNSTSIAQIVDGKLTFRPIFMDHPNYDSHGEMTLDILNLPALIREWQGRFK